MRTAAHSRCNRTLGCPLSIVHACSRVPLVSEASDETSMLAARCQSRTAKKHTNVAVSLTHVLSAPQALQHFLAQIDPTRWRQVGPASARRSPARAAGAAAPATLKALQRVAPTGALLTCPHTHVGLELLYLAIAS